MIADSKPRLRSRGPVVPKICLGFLLATGAAACPAGKPATSVAVPAVVAAFEASADVGAESGEAPPPPKATASPRRPAPQKLLAPSRLALVAPKRFIVAFSTTQGAFAVEVKRSWAPRGADRFYGLVSAGFFDGMAFHRVLKGMFVEFGIHGHPAVSATWLNARIEDDPPPHLQNRRGFVSFVSRGPLTRSTELLINLGSNPLQDANGTVPFGRVVYGMDIVDRLHPPSGGPDQGEVPETLRLRREGDAYLEREHVKVDRIVVAQLVGRLHTARRSHR